MNREKYIVKSYERTCFACPSQWDIYTLDGKYIYAQYRWGHLTLTLNAFTKISRVILSQNIGNGLDGMLSDEEFREITSGILDWGCV